MRFLLHFLPRIFKSDHRFSGLVLWQPVSLALLLLILLLLTLSASASAQPGRFKFEHLDEEENILDRQVSKLHQDQRGFLWAATTEGLGVYDGNSFRFFRQIFGTPSLAHNDVRAIAEEPDGRLWVGTYGGGLDLFDPRDASFVNYRHDPQDPNSLGNDQIWALAFDADGFLWIGTYGGGLDRFDPRTQTFLHFHHDPEDPTSLADDTVSQIEIDSEGRLWIAGSGGLSSLDPRTVDLDGRANFVRYRHEPGNPESLSENFIWSIEPSADGRIWIGTVTQGLERLDPKTGKVEHFPSDPLGNKGPSAGSVYDLAEDELGRLWVGAEFGLDLYDPKQGTFHHYRKKPGVPSSLRFDRITHIFHDRSRVIWIGTSRGLDRINPRSESFIHYRPDPTDPFALSRPRVLSITEAYGQTWIGTMDGLEALDRSTGRFARYDDSDLSTGLKSDYISWLGTTRDGTLWLATGYAGLARFDPATQRFTHLAHNPDDPESLISSDVIHMEEDRHGNLWIGTWGSGISRLDAASRRSGEERFTHLQTDPKDPKSLADGFVSSIVEAADGRLWIGTWWAGLQELHPETQTFTHYPALDGDPGGPSSSRIYWIHPDPSGVLWLGTEAGGLNRFDPVTKKFQYYLPELTIVSILPGEEKELWLATTSQGLVRFDLERREILQTYDSADGVQGNTFGFQSAYKNAEGELYFGGYGGFNVFHPSKIEDNPHPPQVALSRVEVLDDTIDLRDWMSTDGFVQMQHDENSISLHFAALEFTAPRKNLFAYRFDESTIVGDETATQWMPLDRGEITFPRLSTGEHILRVRGSNNQGVWNEEGVTVRLRVLAPWWRTPPFLVLWLLVATGLILGVHRLRLLAVRKYVQALEQEIDHRQEVEEELEAKNAELENFNYTVSHDLKSPLFTIRGFVGMLRVDAQMGRTDRFEAHIQRVEEGVTRMQELLDDLLELSRAGRLTNHSEIVDIAGIARESARAVEHRVRERNAEIVIAPTLIRRRVDPTRMYQVFQNLVDNAVKFVPEGRIPRVEISLRQDGDEDVITVSDNGPGVSPKYQEKIFALFERHHHNVQGTGVGLTLVRRIIHLHGGRIWIESEGDDTGSTFCFTLVGLEDPGAATAEVAESADT